MKLKTFAPSAQKFSALQQFAVVVQTADQQGIIAETAKMLANPLFASPGWQHALRKFHSVLIDGMPRFTVFAEGNSKLPFLAYSTLPIVTCPGAGECLNFCYSVTAWRYPSAFFRQAQNAYLQRFAPLTLRDELKAKLTESKFKDMPRVDFRLFVDGDFDSMPTLQFWMDTIRLQPKLAAYGYSKSFNLFIEANNAGMHWPMNYMVNLSSGHNADDATEQQFAALPVVRGKFVAVSIGHKVKSSEHGTKDNNNKLRHAYGKNAFTCPGKCGECTPKGHACGSDRFKGVDIIIAVH